MKMMGLENLRIEKKDVYQGIDEKEIDVITLDLPEPWNALQHCEKALKYGGFLVCYLPSITQVSRLIAEAKKYDSFIYLKTAEFLERNWKIDGALIARPETEMLGHTGFLTFIRKV
jgi:tRNA (adenine57-N1/adenine58-N1)-methyltransferase